MVGLSGRLEGSPLFLLGDPDMAERSEEAVTAYLEAIGRGDEQAKARLWSMVYEELRGIAGAMMRRESAGHTLQPTALVNEAYLRLLGGAELGQQNRAYFFSAAAQAMRRILIEHGRRSRQAKGRGGEGDVLGQLTDGLTRHGGAASPEDLRALDESLDALAEHDRRVFDVLMLRFFGGLTIEQTADALEISPRTVKRCWTYGRAWLYRRLAGERG